VTILADLEIVATGCAVVVGALILLWWLTALIGRIVALSGGGGSALATTGSGLPVASGIPPHHLVTIAAAIEATLGSDHQIVAISAPAHRVPAWASSGRRGAPDRRPALGGFLNERTDGS